MKGFYPLFLNSQSWSPHRRNYRNTGSWTHFLIYYYTYPSVENSF